MFPLEQSRHSSDGLQAATARPPGADTNPEGKLCMQPGAFVEPSAVSHINDMTADGVGDSAHDPDIPLLLHNAAARAINGGIRGRRILCVLALEAIEHHIDDRGTLEVWAQAVESKLSGMDGLSTPDEEADSLDEERSSESYAQAEGVGAFASPESSSRGSEEGQSTSDAEVDLGDTGSTVRPGGCLADQPVAPAIPAPPATFGAADDRQALHQQLDGQGLPTSNVPYGAAAALATEQCPMPVQSLKAERGHGQLGQLPVIMGVGPGADTNLSDVRIMSRLRSDDLYGAAEAPAPEQCPTPALSP